MGSCFDPEREDRVQRWGYDPEEVLLAAIQSGDNDEWLKENALKILEIQFASLQHARQNDYEPVLLPASVMRRIVKLCLGHELSNDELQRLSDVFGVAQDYS
jgi:hypothetical protein